MARTEDSPWAVSVAQVASRPGQSKEIDATFPAPSGIGDEIVGVDEGADVSVVGSFDSIVDGLILNARISAPVHAECTRCLKPIDEDWPVDVTVFFPYESGQDKANGKGGKSKKDDEIDIIAGEDESEDTYPLLENGAFADIEAMIRDTLGVLGRNAAVGHDGHLAVQPGELIQIFQRAVLQDDIIAALAQIHGELGSDKVAHLLYTPNSRTVRQVWFSSRSSAAVSSAVGSPTSST